MDLIKYAKCWFKNVKYVNSWKKVIALLIVAGLVLFTVLRLTAPTIRVNSTTINYYIDSKSDTARVDRKDVF